MNPDLVALLELMAVLMAGAVLTALGVPVQVVASAMAIGLFVTVRAWWEDKNDWPGGAA